MINLLWWILNGETFQSILTKLEEKKSDISTKLKPLS